MRGLPEVAGAIQAQSPESMGMSYELADARVEDMRAEVWKLTRVTLPERQSCSGRRRPTGYELPHGELARTVHSSQFTVLSQ